MENLFGGEKKLSELLQDNKTEELDLERLIETTKRNLSAHNGQVNFSLGALFDHYKPDDTTSQHSMKGTKGSKPKVKHGKLKIPLEDIHEFFKPAVNGITEHIREMFNDPKASDVQNVLLVGGFAECVIVQDSLRQLLRDQTVVIPEDAGMTVLKGAVMFGHRPSIVSGRICRYYFGTQNLCFFMDGFHDEERKEKHGDTYYCRDVFEQLTEKGQLFKTNDAYSHEVFPVKKGLPSLTINFYQSEKSNTRYCTDDDTCKYVGKVVIDVPKDADTDRKFLVRLTYGETSLKCSVVDEKTQTEVKSVFQLLGDN